MNIENIYRVIDAIQAESVATFNMDKWVEVTDCGTAACIAGHCVLLSGVKLHDPTDWSSTPYANEQMSVPIGRDFLDLDNAQARELFLPMRYIGTDKITKDVAIRALHNLALTGKVDWEAAVKGNTPALPAAPVKTLTRDPSTAA